MTGLSTASGGEKAGLATAERRKELGKIRMAHGTWEYWWEHTVYQGTEPLQVSPGQARLLLVAHLKVVDREDFDAYRYTIDGNLRKLPRK